MQKLLLFSGIKYTVKPTKSLIANKKNLMFIILHIDSKNHQILPDLRFHNYLYMCILEDYLIKDHH